MYQELLALSTALSATLTAQIGFDARQLKHCSTYHLAEGVDGSNKDRKTIYRLRSDEYELAVTPRPSRRRGAANVNSRLISCYACLWTCISRIRKHLETFIDHRATQRFILFCILINTFSMGIEYHLQVSSEGGGTPRFNTSSTTDLFAA